MAGDVSLHAAVFFAQGPVEGEHADVGEETGQETFILLEDLEMLGQDAGGGGGVDAVTPVANGIETADLLLAEMAIIFQWFNPFAWLYRKELENNLEYLTDNQLLQHKSVEKTNYQLSLLKVAEMLIASS